jgi:hypothetical protein
VAQSFPDQSVNHQRRAGRLSAALWCMVAIFAVSAILAVSLVERKARWAGLQEDVSRWKRDVMLRNHDVIADVYVSKDLRIVDIGVREHKWWALSLQARKQFLQNVRREYTRFCNQHELPSKDLVIYVEGPSVGDIQTRRWYRYAESGPEESVVIHSRDSTGVLVWKTGQ